jgi:hypothetical protein
MGPLPRGHHLLRLRAHHRSARTLQPSGRLHLRAQHRRRIVLPERRYSAYDVSLSLLHTHPLNNTHTPSLLLLTTPLATAHGPSKPATHGAEPTKKPAWACAPTDSPGARWRPCSSRPWRSAPLARPAARIARRRRRRVAGAFPSSAGGAAVVAAAASLTRSMGGSRMSMRD